MVLDLIVVVGALLITFLVFRWLIGVIKMSVTTAFAIALVVLALQLAFGIAPDQVWEQITNLPQLLQDLLGGWARKVGITFDQFFARKLVVRGHSFVDLQISSQRPSSDAPIPPMYTWPGRSPGR